MAEAVARRRQIRPPDDVVYDTDAIVGDEIIGEGRDISAPIPDGNSVSGSSSQASSQRMLSFRSMSRDASFRSSNSSLNYGDAHSTVCTLTTPPRRLGHFTSNSSIICSPRRSASISLPSVDPFSQDQLHVLHRCASSNNSHGDSLSMAETLLHSVTKSIGRRIPKTPSQILDAPELVDDYYLNLVRWGEINV